jgi:hypothetical protein
MFPTAVIVVKCFVLKAQGGGIQLHSDLPAGYVTVATEHSQQFQTQTFLHYPLPLI